MVGYGGSDGSITGETGKSGGANLQIPSSWNDTYKKGSMEEPIHELIARRAVEDPDRLAVTDDSCSLTYKDLNGRANGLAQRLKEWDICLETPVAVCMESSAEMVVCLLAVMKAGGCYTPIDPAYPDDRVSYILEDSGAPVLLTSDPKRFSSLKKEVIDPTDLQWEEEFHPRVEAGLEHRAYIIYTSGSTGRPKGVEVTHGALLNLLNWHCDTWEVSNRDRATQIAGPAFDASVWEIWPYLAVGASVFIPRGETRLHPFQLMAWMKEHEISCAFVPTPLAEAILAESGGIDLNLRVLLTGGDRLQRRPDKNFPARFINAYGPTENTVVSTCGEVMPGDDDSLPSIGRPVDNTRAYVLDGSGTPVPVGDEGELWVGGMSLARGYLGRPGLTAEKFIPNPFEGDGARLYRTGDLVRYNDQGEILFVGRIDHQVKIRGFRIELGEIEWVLSQHPQVHSCMILVRDDLEAYGIRGKVLIAYLIGLKERPDDMVLREFLGERLPEYMVPTGFLTLESFPMTANGKVDRKALTEMSLPNLMVDRHSTYVPPRNPVEEQLVAWWGEVLGVEKPGVRDNFFSLGGHSLLLARLGALMEEHISFAPPLSELFQRLTIEKQAEWLIGVMLSASMDQKKPAPRKLLPQLVREDHGHFPLSSAQKRLWFIDRMAPGSPVYNLPLAFQLEGDLDVPSLQQSLDYLIQRHEVLRTTFANVDGEPRQFIGPPVPAVLDIYDLREEPKRDERVREILLEEAGSSFNLEKGPPVRFNLLQLLDQRFLFQVNMHHIVGDASSFQIFMEELGCCHEACKNGEAPSLPALERQYVDYAAWEERCLVGHQIQEQLDWWTAHLADPPVLELPTDRPRPKRQTFRGEEYRFVLPANLSRKISVLANREEATPFMTLLAGYLLLLQRFSNQEDLVVGFPNTNRELPEIQGVLGFFINTLAPRFNLSSFQTVRELIRQVRTVILDVKSRSDLPFDKLVEALQPDRDLSRSLLFQAAFSYFSKSAVEPDFPGLKLKRHFFDRGLAHFDQLLVVEETEDGFSGSLEYNADLFNGSTMERMAAHYLLILDDFCINPDHALHQCASFPDHEIRLLLHQWNQTASPTRGPIAPQLFQEAAAAYKDQHALVAYEKDGCRAITYEILARRVDHLAAWLWNEGVRQETVIGICMNRCPEAVIAMLAIHALGGAYVPVDPIYPSDRVAFMVEDAGIGFFFTRKEDEPADLGSHQFNARILYMEPDGIFQETHVLNWTVLDQVEPTCFPRLVNEENTAYFIFTSGSTGRPKGVPMRHGALRNFIDWFSKAFQIDHRVQGSLVAGPAFDGTIMEIWPYISLGATIHIPPEEARLNPVLLDRFFNKNKVTHTFCPTPIAEALMDAWDPGSSELVFLITGGDRLRKRPQAAFRGKLINVYGPSEASCIASFSAVPSQGDQLPDIGTVVQNARFYITDAHMRPVPIGCAGELLIGGICLSPGYLGRPALASAQFVPDPFDNEPGSRLYKTGDRVRYQPHGGGTLEFIDRIDTQVKIRGVRIELGEIESCLYQCPEVETALVMVREDSGGEKRLVAYVQPGDSQEDEAALNDLLRHALLDLLPEYMVPDPFVFLDVFPLTPNGKINRRALPAPDLSRERLGLDYLAPRNPVEEQLVQIWEDILKLNRVGVRDNFFQLGGHSLLAMRVLSAIRDIMGCEIPVETIFVHSTIEELALQMPEAQIQHAISRRGEGQERLERSWPMSFAQQRLWFIQRMVPDLVAYNTPFAWRLRGILNEDALQEALTELVARHESLRTLFHEEEDQGVQVVQAPFKVALEFIDLSGHEQPEQEAELIARNLAVHLFDLETGPLFRVFLVTLGRDYHVLMLNLHHIITDGWSTSVFLEELAACYDAFSKGIVPDLPELPIQYPDYAQWQRDYLQGEVLEEQLAWWRDQLNHPPVLELPLDKPRPGDKTWNGGFSMNLLPASLATRVKALGLAHDASLFMTLLTAFYVLLERYTGQDDFIVGSPVAGRNRKELEGQIGFFVNTLAIRLKMEATEFGPPTFLDLLHRVKAATLGAYAHGEIPFDKLVAELNPDRDSSRSVFFDVMFSFQNVLSSKVSMPGLDVEPFPFETQISHVDFTLVVEEQDDALTAAVYYNTDLFHPSTMQRMTDHFRLILEEAVEAPDKRACGGDILTVEEKKWLLHDWDGLEMEWEGSDLTYQMVCAQAKKHPDRPALISYEEPCRAITYQMLIRRACQLSLWLEEYGIKVGDKVGICVRRSPEALVVMLAVHGAGGVYVPIDPLYPPDRIGFMLEDAGASILFTSQDDCPFVPGQQPQSTDLVYMNSQGFDRQGTHTLWSQFDKIPAIQLPQTVTLNHGAYIIYTSGSTGRPKGVVITHASLMNLVAWVLHEWHEGEPIQCALIAGPAFDATILEIWPFLAVGAQFHIPGEGTRLDPVLLSKFFKEHQLTHAFCPTPLIESMIQEECLPELPYLITGGDRLRKRPPQGYKGRLINVYGPSEATVMATTSVVRPEGQGLPDIGCAVPNSRVYVVDPFLEPVSLGVHGELVIGGVCLSSGYLNRPALTAAQFVPDPFSRIPGERLYKTGDRVRYQTMGKGVLNFIDRLDTQVQIRGFRVELGEIESVMNSVGGVAQSMALILETKTDDSKLVGYIRTEKGSALTESGLRCFLEEALPDYMVPSVFVFLEIFPLTPNGKIDRKALPAPDWSMTDEDNYLAPRTEVEGKLASIWSEVLSLERVGVRQSFFELGGHSLLATQIVSQIRRKFEVELSLMVFFKNPTIEHQALEIERNMGMGGALSMIKAVPRESGKPLPVSFSQSRLYFSFRMAPTSPAGNIPVGYRLRGSLNISCLARAIQDIVARHEALRTVFVENKGKPGQRVLGTDHSYPLSVVDLKGVSHGETLAQQLVDLEAQKPFNLARDPLARWTLICLDDQEYLFLVTMHHIVSDGWSTGVFERELTSLYDSYARGQQPELSVLPIQYADYAHWQNEWISSPEAKELEAWWVKQLSNNISIALTPRPRPTQPNYLCKIETFQLSKDLCSKLALYCAREEVSLFMVLLAIFKTVRYVMLGEKSPVTGTIVANRNRVELEELIGIFINTLALCVEVPENHGKPNLPAMIHLMRETTLQAYACQEYPFDKLVDVLNPPRLPGVNPIFQTLFIYNRSTDPFQLSDLNVEPIPPDLSYSAFDLNLTFNEGMGADGIELTGRLVYQTQLFERELIQQVTSQFVVFLEELVKDIYLSSPSVTVVEYETCPEAINLSGRLRYSLSNSKVYVLDRYLNQLPIGCPGELCIESPGLARGYANDSALTAALFTPNPFSTTPGSRLHHTGEIGYFDGNGRIIRGLN